MYQNLHTVSLDLRELGGIRLTSRNGCKAEIFGDLCRRRKELVERESNVSKPHIDDEREGDSVEESAGLPFASTTLKRRRAFQDS